MKYILSIILSLTLLITQFSVCAADESTTEPPAEPTTVSQTTEKKEPTTKNKKKAKAEAKKTLKAQKKDLEKKMLENSKKLKSLEGSAKASEAYIDALDEKIGYLNEELNLLDVEVKKSEGKISALNSKIEPIKKELASLQALYDKAKKEYDELNKEFEKTYDAYCFRLRAMYISGHTSVIAALLTSEDLEQFLSRFEMIKTVSKSDTELLKDVNEKIDKIVTEQNGLKEKQKEIEKKKNELTSKQDALKKEQEALTNKQNEIADKKIAIAQDRAQSDMLFAEYTQKMQLYTEFRNEDEEIIKKVNKEIDDLLSGLKSPEEVTTAKNPEHDEKKVTGEYGGTGELFNRSNAALSLCYPVPGHHGVSQEFGHYRNGKAHTGIDFPCPKNSKVVAAQKGIVVKVKRLNYSYGYYVMVYHGTDAKGRKIVTLYAHNSSLLVSAGQSVRKGQQIAWSGSTGNSTGPHCHFEVIINSTKVNPKNYLG